MIFSARCIVFTLQSNCCRFLLAMFRLLVCRVSLFVLSLWPTRRSRNELGPLLSIGVHCSIFLCYANFASACVFVNNLFEDCPRRMRDVAVLVSDPFVFYTLSFIHKRIKTIGCRVTMLNANTNGSHSVCFFFH